MNSIASYAVLIALLIPIVALAIAGCRKARLMSKEHLQQLAQSGEEDRLADPKTKEDYFLRLMSLKDVALGLTGAVFFLYGLGKLQSWLS